jgi:hypothetical protein
MISTLLKVLLVVAGVVSFIVIDRPANAEDVSSTALFAEPGAMFSATVEGRLGTGVSTSVFIQH